MEKEALFGAVKSAIGRGVTAYKSVNPKAGMAARFQSGADTFKRSMMAGKSGQTIRGVGNHVMNNKKKYGAGAVATTFGAGHMMGSPSASHNRNTYSRGYRAARTKFASFEDIPIHKFMSQDTISCLAKAGMNKVAAVMEKQATGRDIQEIDLAVTAQILGEKSFIKRAEQKRIASGLAALRELRR